MVEFNLIVDHSEESLAAVKTVFNLLGLKIDILELREAPIINDTNHKKVKDIYVIDCWSTFDDYVKLLVSGKWTVINYEDRVTLIA